MAIVTKDLNNCIYEDGIREIKSFIEEHNPNLFDHITVTSGGSEAIMHCYFNDTKQCLAVYLAVPNSSDSHTNFTVYAKGSGVTGERISDYSAPYSDRLSKIYSTSNGIMITGAHNSLSSSDYRSSVIVSKEGDNGLCITLMSRDGNGTDHSVSKEGHVHWDSSIYIEHIVSDTSTFTNQLMIVTARKSKTMLIPIVFANGLVTNNLFRMVYNENPESETTFTLGGNRFVSNGVFALKD